VSAAFFLFGEHLLTPSMPCGHPTSVSGNDPDVYDVAVVGTGWGGLGAALRLVEAGAKVIVFETLNYPGGCAGSFTKHRQTYEAGATLFSGFGDQGLFRAWIERHAMPVRFVPMDPVVELRSESFTLKVPSTRPEFLRAFAQLAPERAPAIQNFFAEQKHVADTLWRIMDSPDLLPPWTAASLMKHGRHAFEYARILGPHVGRSLEPMLRRHKLLDCMPLRVYLDAVCQITIQVAAAEAEAPFALSAMDYFFRGTGHIDGGIGSFARAIVAVIKAKGATVRMPDRVKRVTRADGGFWVESRGGRFHARTLVANTLPSTYAQLREREHDGPLLSRAARVRESWGACMLYLELPGDAPLDQAPHHVEMIDSEARALIEGNHVFASVSEVKESGARTATLSTHVHAEKAAGIEGASYCSRVADAMRKTCGLRYPALLASAVRSFSASPRTFERFTGRPSGLVGGPPRRVGLHNYAEIGPCEIERGGYLVGDSVFPGQSTLATALGGVRTAEKILRG
jgi:phytoene dehydrogenase-like protein